jgi:hypothetical protein
MELCGSVQIITDTDPEAQKLTDPEHWTGLVIILSGCGDGPLSALQARHKGHQREADRDEGAGGIQSGGLARQNSCRGISGLRTKP